MRRILLLSVFSMLCTGAFARQEKITGVTMLFPFFLYYWEIYYLCHLI